MHKRFLALSLILAFSGLAFGQAAPVEEVTLQLQRGLEGYAGVIDTLLYAPSSVANINYGASSGLSAGINRWNEHYASILRFDLTHIPPGAKVTDAKLILYEDSEDWPDQEIQLAICAIAPANAGWIEGENTGTRVPIAGTPCWNFLSYDDQPWAGDPGLRKEGVDYLMPPLGSACVSPGHEGTVEIALRADAVQQWIDDPASNAGLRLGVSEAKKKGQVFYARSSDHSREPDTRPSLILSIEMDEAVALTYWHNVASRALEAARASLTGYEKAFREGGEPKRAREAFAAFSQRLEHQESIVEAGTGITREALLGAVEDMEQIHDEIGQAYEDLTLACAAEANERRGLATDFALASADSMTNVLRTPRFFQGAFAGQAPLEMAKNEFEATQILIIPIDKEVSAATWSLQDLAGPDGAKIPASAIDVQVMGYMKKVKPAAIAPEFDEVDWWPVPILDFMDRVDVPRGEIQPLWVCVHTQADTPAGTYTGALTIQSPGLEPKSIDLQVRVFDFAVPKEQHVLTVWGNNEPMFEKVYGEQYDKAMARAMFDFLLDHRLAVNSLYACQAAGEPGITGSVGYPTLSDPAELRRLWEAGSRWWNLGYLHPTFAKQAGMELDEFVPHFIEMTQESLRVAEAAGWPRSNLGIYFFDETRDFEALQKAASQVKEAFPDIPLMTTGYDRSYGVKGGPIDDAIDIWCPLTPRYAEDWEIIEQGREKGKKAWWYVCCGPRGEKDLNFFCQQPAIRPRLLMGVATWKYQPDGFLYYRISGWRDYEKPMDTGPLTGWKPYYLPGPDGDGLLILPGPAGPLSTLQFENIRDGLEDYEYYWLLQQAIDKAKAAGIDVGEAAQLLEVPADLLESLLDYSEDPARLRAQRRRVAEAIEAIEEELAGR